MRLGEQTTLEVQQADFARNEILLEETKNGDSREIPMVPEVRAALRQLIGTRRSGLVQQRERGGAGAVDLDWFQDLVRELNIDDYSWHNNRHTFCSWLAIAGKPLKTIQELAGHRTIQTTAKYAHLTPNRKRADLEDMAAGLRKTQPITRARRQS
jgi:site-specific recombinase XerD